MTIDLNRIKNLHKVNVFLNIQAIIAQLYPSFIHTQDEKSLPSRFRNTRQLYDVICSRDGSSTNIKTVINMCQQANPVSRKRSFISPTFLFLSFSSLLLPSANISRMRKYSFNGAVLFRKVFYFKNLYQGITVSAGDFSVRRRGKKKLLIV